MCNSYKGGNVHLSKISPITKVVVLLFFIIYEILNATYNPLTRLIINFCNLLRRCPEVLLKIVTGKAIIKEAFPIHPDRNALLSIFDN